MKSYLKYLFILLLASDLAYGSQRNIGRKSSRDDSDFVTQKTEPPKKSLRTEDPIINSTYADATVDTAFKEMMWRKDNDPVALSFIQTFVPELKVESVEKLESAPLAIPALKPRGKKQTFMDFHVKSKDGHHYIVEMQSQRHVRFDERALFYTCSVYSRQLEQKHFNDPSWYMHLKPVIAIQVVDYDTNRAEGIGVKGGSGIDPSDQDFVDRIKANPLPQGKSEKHFMMTCQHSGQKLDHIQMIQIELPRYKIDRLPKKGEKSTDKDWWIRVLRYSDQYKEEDFKGVKPPSFVTEALDRLTFSKWDPVVIQEYKESVLDRGKYSTALQVEREEGKAEGANEERIRIATDLMDVLDDETIAKKSKLPLEEVKKLRRSLQNS